MGIKHEWNGTILTITSDSGTSSMDLKGDKGNKGCRGPQGRAGCIVNPDGTVDMTGYATETYVDEKLSDVQDVDLSDYYTKQQVLTLVDNARTDLTGYATEEYVDNAVADVDVDLTGYATENFVTTKIAAAQLEGAGVDVSGFATTEYVDNAVNSGVGRHGTGMSAEIFNGAMTASGDYAHAEGQATNVTGHGGSHAEGRSTTASGNTAHAEGYRSEAKGHYSHAEGYWTIAASDYQHVQGSYNIEDNAEKYLHIVGNGKYATNRSNAFTLDWDGNAWFKGKVYVGGTSMDDAVELGTGGTGGSSSCEVKHITVNNYTELNALDSGYYWLDETVELPDFGAYSGPFIKDAGVLDFFNCGCYLWSDNITEGTFYYYVTYDMMEDYYTKEEVDNKIINGGSGGTVDLSTYATKDYVTGLGYQTEAQVLALIQANMPASGDEVRY